MSPIEPSSMKLANGSVNSVHGGATVALGNPPADASDDWLAVIAKVTASAQ